MGSACWRPVPLTAQEERRVGKPFFRRVPAPYFVFNVTGNILMFGESHGDMPSAAQRQFQQVAAFFAAFTVALAKLGTSLHDYRAVSAILERSPLFVRLFQATEHTWTTSEVESTEDTKATTSSVADLLGFNLGPDDPNNDTAATKPFRDALLHAIFNKGEELLSAGNEESSHVSHLLFVCMVAHGEPIVVAMHYHVDVAEHIDWFYRSCCCGLYRHYRKTTSSSRVDWNVKRSTYLFFAPQAVRELTPWQARKKLEILQQVVAGELLSEDFHRIQAAEAFLNQTERGRNVKYYHRWRKAARRRHLLRAVLENTALGRRFVCLRRWMAYARAAHARRCAGATHREPFAAPG